MSAPSLRRAGTYGGAVGKPVVDEDDDEDEEEEPQRAVAAAMAATDAVDPLGLDWRTEVLRTALLGKVPVHLTRVLGGSPGGKEAVRPSCPQPEEQQPCGEEEQPQHEPQQEETEEGCLPAASLRVAVLTAALVGKVPVRSLTTVEDAEAIYGGLAVGAPLGGSPLSGAYSA